MNIQVDNLCQFLPQDKVCNFAALSFQDLLKETEKAVGSEAMLQLHNQLIDLRKQEKELDLVRNHSILLFTQLANTRTWKTLGRFKTSTKKCRKRCFEIPRTSTMAQKN